MDSVGIGAALDANLFFNRDIAGEQIPDTSSDTLGHIAEQAGLHVPNMENLGLGMIRRTSPLKGIKAIMDHVGYVTKLEEVSRGKDTMTGHWEIMGLNITKPFQTFPNGFPEDLLKKIEDFSGRGILREANKPYSGTKVINDFGPCQMETGKFIVYTSADPVLQIAAHEEIIALDELYKVCEYVRSITLESPYKIGRIIARPYIGEAGSFTRTKGRRDYALSPFAPTVLDHLIENDIPVFSIGKIYDIFNGQGIDHDMGHTANNMEGIDKLIEVIHLSYFKKGFSFTNLVDFDALFGHRRDVYGYGKAIEDFDNRLPEVINAMHEDDLLMITADHGNDPAYGGTDHTREYVPLMVFSKSLLGSGSLPKGNFADISATIAQNFGVPSTENGKSFLSKLV